MNSNNFSTYLFHRQKKNRNFFFILFTLVQTAKQKFKVLPFIYNSILKKKKRGGGLCRDKRNRWWVISYIECEDQLKKKIGSMYLSPLLHLFSVLLNKQRGWVKIQ